MSYVSPIQALCDRAEAEPQAVSFFGDAFGAALDQISDSGCIDVGGQKAYRRRLPLNEAFDGLLASMTAHRVGAPVAPQLIHKRSAKSQYDLYSLVGFTTPVTVTSSMIGITDWTRIYEREQLTAWQQAAAETTRLTKEQLEFQLFKGTLSHVAALLPYLAWIGEGDMGGHNCVYDAAKITTLPEHARRREVEEKDIPLYGIDYYTGNASFFTVSDVFAGYYGRFHTPRRLVDAIDDDPLLDYEDRLRAERYTCSVAEELLLPFVDWRTARDITCRIINLSQRDIQSCVAKTMEALEPHCPAGKRSILRHQAQQRFSTLTARREGMRDYLYQCRDYSSTPRVMADNPFPEFRKRLDAYRV